MVRRAVCPHRRSAAREHEIRRKNCADPPHHTIARDRPRSGKRGESMKYRWIVFVIVIAACRSAPAPFDGAALFRSGRMYELRDRLRAERGDSPDASARNAILLARVYIDLHVVWDDAKLADALAVLAAARPSDPKLV